ncbi:UNKNOWN [Stylonychia lemnae]|uniref:Uncharacterized protein n=1 Tax=Stylonychia lemnae TaxID=5949 RepID=A0A077ZZZ8_STYLE|nr:UNKNOWN [Stylonychia lemnae]|eukprot:CDW74098.1 UNKNOWN [Stylonychia lemnae]
MQEETLVLKQQSQFIPVQFGTRYIIEELTSENFDEFTDLVAEEYHLNDPLSIVLGATSTGYREAMESLKGIMLSQNQGFIARCTNSGMVVGGLTGEDYQAVYDFKKDQALETYYGRLNEGKQILYDRGVLKKEWKISLMTMGITRSTHYQQYIMTVLTYNVMLKAKHLGFEYAVAEVNHIGTYKIFSKDSHKILISVDFHDKYEEIKNNLSQEEKDFIQQSGLSDYIFFMKLDSAIVKRQEYLKSKQ